MKCASGRLSSLGFCLAIICSSVSAAAAAVSSDPAVAGRWSLGPNLPYFPVHAHLLPTAKIMIWPGDVANGGASGNDTRAWDPITNSVSLLAKPGYDLFCAGHSFLADGRLFVAGGHLGLANDLGLKNASIYNPFTNTWTALPDMNAGRWYPTSTTLANSDALVISGSTDIFGGINPLPQVFQLQTGTWRNLTNAQMGIDQYPRMHLAPNGKVFNSSPSTATRYLDTAGSGNWTPVANRTVYRDYGSSVLYGDGKILIMGGGDPPTNTAEVIDLNAPSPAWRAVAPMAFARRHLNATILPDGNVLVTGGTSGSGFSDPTNAVWAAEMWNPATESWTTLASSAQIPRVYHSIAVLLPDGRILTTGGNGYTQAEIYEPPYLFKGARPTITSAPGSIGYGQSFFLQTPDAATITQVTLVRIGSVTHAFDMDQRFSRLSFSQTAGGLNAVAPPNANLAPPGFYMVFVVNSNGVPSVGQFVQISTAGQGANPIPSVSSLSPSSALAGGASFPLTVNGNNFVPSSVVQWNGSARSTTFVSATQLTAAISASDIAQAGIGSVTVVNPSPGGGISNALGFTITPSGSGVYLSDLAWVSVTSGWGPVELDRSNGEALAGDGLTLTIRGQTYAKGLGVHAFSDIVYALNGQYATFLSAVGVDDEVAMGASVVFEVWVDGVKQYDSGVLTRTSAVTTVSINVTGKSTLRLIVTDGGDGNGRDHADWADARLMVVSDTTPPDTNITNAPASPSNSSSASFSFTSTESGSSFECKLDAGSFAACANPKSYTGLASGSHTFQVRAIDLVGNIDATPASYTWTIDLTPPSVNITSPTSNPTYTTSTSPLNLGGTAGDNNALAQVTWSNDRGGSGTAAGTTSWTASGIVLQSGTNILTVTARDAAGNTANANLSVNYAVLDTTPPDTSITATPANPSGSGSASFSFTSNEAGSSFECQLDGGGFAACASPQGYVGLSDGSHIFEVRAIDLAGNVDPTPAIYNWTIDTAVPTDLVAAYGFDEGSGTSVGDSSGNGYTGSIVGAAWTASGKYGNALVFNGTGSYVSAPILSLPTGDYTWSAWINPNQTNTFRGIMVSRGSGLGGLELDIAAGRISVWSNGNLEFDSAATIPTGVWSHLALTRSGSSIGLYINGNLDPATATDGLVNDFAGCPLLIGVDNDSDCTGSLNGYFNGLIDEIRIYNRALSQAEIQSYMNTPITAPGPDTTPPETSITASPTNPSNSANANFSFTSSEAGSTFECQLDGGGFAACSSPKSYTALGNGSHTFQVRGIDLAKNVDQSPASYSWTIDTFPPDTAISTFPSNPSANGDASFSFSSPEPGVSFQCKLDGAAFSGCTSPKTYTGLTSGSHTFQVRSVDPAGNIDPTPASYNWTYTPVTRFPNGTVVQTGSLGSGSAASLNADDNNFYVVNSTTSGTRTTAWYGSFAGLTSALSNLKISYRGKNSSTCTQTIAVWRWSDSTWVQLDSRSVGNSEVTIANLVPPGAAGQYVSGAGELRVRIRCTRSGNFTASGELMNIFYDSP